MIVRNEAGEKLGKVADVSGDRFVIEKGLLFKNDFEAPLDQIVEIRDDEIICSPMGQAAATSGAVSTEPASEPTTATQASSAGGDELRVPLVEEELEVEKRPHERTAVRIGKEVVTEHKEVTVPVTREEVKVERVPAGGEPATERTGAFAESEIAVPVVEEEVVVSKRPVVREEVRVRKEQVQEQRAVAADVQREEAHVHDVEEEARRRTVAETEEPAMRAPGTDDDIKR